MALRFGNKIISYVRSSSSLRTRSYSSESLSQPPKGFSTATVVAVETSGLAMCAYWFYHYDALFCRTKVENWKKGKKVEERLMRLLREDYDSMDAFLETLDREAEALKEKLLERDISLMDVEVYRREIAAMNKMVKICADQKANVGVFSSADQKA